MSPAMLAVLTGLFLALASLYIRWGLERGTSGAAVLIVNMISAFVAWPLYLVFASHSDTSNWAVLAFVGAGVTGLFLGRVLLFAGMQRVGVAVSTPLYNVQAPLSVMGGAILFSEALSPLIGLGTAAAVGGAGLLCLGKFSLGLEQRAQLRELALPLASGMCIAAGFVLRKWGLLETPDIYLGLAIMTSTAFVISLGSAVIHRQTIRFPTGRPLKMFVMAGLMTNVAHLSSLAALLHGNLVVVIPLQNTEMLFALLLSLVFLRRLEQVTLAVVAGAALVMMGAVLVNL
ncbi:MAG: DMT family transporter [Chloroflexota bacterium]|nr:DMT family transporter [Chloroflexota bacterium]MDE2968697.1 DMT family transporter [Chloroflexota bacterium]